MEYSSGSIYGQPGNKSKKIIRLLLQKLKSFLSSHPVEQLWLTRRQRKLFFFSAVLFIIIWQTIIYFGNVEFSPEFRRADATGFNHLWAKEFFYFYYYKNLFPLATTDTTKEYSVQGADRIIHQNPKSLRMEWGHWYRFGESARIWLYLPYAILKGSPENPQIILTNYLVFTLALIGLFISLYKIGKPFLGLLLVLIIGNSPFMLYETYNNNNVFALMASYAILLFSMHQGHIFEKKTFWEIMSPLFSGIMAGTMYHIRSETLPMLLSCIMVYLFNRSFKIQTRALLSFLLLLMFFLTNYIIKSYFQNKYIQTREVVVKAGGVPFDGGKTLVHPIWHPFYCGLGDYDRKYGFSIHDTSVYNRLLPILRKKTGKELKYPGRTIYEMGEYYDKDSLYYKKPETIDGFDELVKEEFFKAVKRDPLWYVEILLHRIKDFFFQVSPVGITIDKEKMIRIPFVGFLSTFFILFVFFIIRERFWVKWILFTMPLGISVIVFFSAYNNSFQSIYHFFSIGLLIYLALGLGSKYKFQKIQK